MARVTCYGMHDDKSHQDPRWPLVVGAQGLAEIFVLVQERNERVQSKFDIKSKSNVHTWFCGVLVCFCFEQGDRQYLEERDGGPVCVVLKVHWMVSLHGQTQSHSMLLIWRQRRTRISHFCFSIIFHIGSQYSDVV